MNASDAKVIIQASKTQAGVYGALDKAGVNTGRSLSESRKLYRNTNQVDKFFLVQCAEKRLQQIENNEV